MAGGIEEVSAILLSQKINPLNKAKLVKVSRIEWDQTFEDEGRKKWHESKMKSKIVRAEKHKNLLGDSAEEGLKGWVIHC